MSATNDALLRMMVIFELERRLAERDELLGKPIEGAIRVLSFPNDWKLRALIWSNDGVSAEYWPPMGHKTWNDGAVIGHGTTADEALRDAQKKAWERWERYKV